ncbi:hypothetical protein HN51_048637 [Arachis hypogaea]
MAPKIFLCILFVAVLLASEATSGTIMVEGERKVCAKSKGKCPDNNAACFEDCVERNYVDGHCEGFNCCCFSHD